MRWNNSAYHRRFLLALGVICMAGVLVFGQSPATQSPPLAPAAPTPQPPVLIVIDPAHGGSDPGALLTP